ncbi:MAG: DUF4886 domain-containing protein [Eubacteriales bacterium]
MSAYTLLAVGNSFSQDALYYLHPLAAAVGIDLDTVNLYIGGCSLERHCRNLQQCTCDYLYELNGTSTGRTVSANEVLDERKWDFIMTQQASHDSGLWETYQPYLSAVQDYFKSHQPDARRLLMQTWAYEQDSTHDKFVRYGRDQQEMHRRLTECYDRAAEECSLPLIPCGTVIENLRKLPPFRYEAGERSICRDGYHMDLIYGRYLLAGTIFTFLFGGDLTENPFLPDGADPAIIDVIQKVIMGR